MNTLKEHQEQIAQFLETSAMYLELKSGESIDTSRMGSPHDFIQGVESSRHPRHAAVGMAPQSIGLGSP